VKTSRIPFLEEWLLFRRGIVMRLIRVKRGENFSRDSASIRAADLVQQQLKWNPKQEYDEQLCVPSEAAAYLEIVKPAAEEK